MIKLCSFGSDQGCSQGSNLHVAEELEGNTCYIWTVEGVNLSVGDIVTTDEREQGEPVTEIHSVSTFPCTQAITIHQNRYCCDPMTLLVVPRPSNILKAKQNNQVTLIRARRRET